MNTWDNNNPILSLCIANANDFLYQMKVAEGDEFFPPKRAAHILTKIVKAGGDY